MRRALLCAGLCFIAACSTDESTSTPDDGGGTAGQQTGGSGQSGGGTGAASGGASGSAGTPAQGGSPAAGGSTGGTAGSTGGSAGATGGTAGSTGGSAGALGGSAGAVGGSAGSPGGAAGATGALYPGCLTPAPDGAAWPTADNTGIPAGTPALEVLEGSLHTQSEGEVYDAVELRGRLYVDHPNVTIRRSKLVGDEYYAIYTTIDDAYLTIEDSDIVGGLLLGNYSTARRNHLHSEGDHHRADGFIFAASHLVLEHNLIDGLIGDAGAHVDGIQVMGGSDIVICHNWIDPASPPIADGGVNAAIFFGPDMGEISDVVVSHNMILGGGSWYSLRLDCSGTIEVRGNRFDDDVLGTPVLNSGEPPTLWEDNAYDDGTPIPAP